jgi:GNAT superfamily N-acetyltransferase
MSLPITSTFEASRATSSPLTARCKVRRAESRDVSTLLAMIQGLAAYEKLENACPVDAMSLTMAFFGPEPQAYALLAEVEGKAAGMAIYFYRFSSFIGSSHLFLDNLFVDPAVRGAGVGKALFRALSQTALSAGCPEIHWRVLGWNEPTISFYQNLGATVQQGWDYYALNKTSMLSMLEEAAQGKK